MYTIQNLRNDIEKLLYDAEEIGIKPMEYIPIEVNNETRHGKVDDINITIKREKGFQKIVIEFISYE